VLALPDVPATAQSGLRMVARSCRSARRLRLFARRLFAEYLI